MDATGSFALIIDENAGSNFLLIRRLALPSCSVTTLAGGLTTGSANGVGTAATFSISWGLAMDAAGTFRASRRLRQPSYSPHIALLSNRVDRSAGGFSAGSANGVGTSSELLLPLDCRNQHFGYICASHRLL